MFTFIFDTNSKTALYEQLYQFVKNGIECRKFLANEKLPSKRELSSHLKISHVTVETAYAQLAAEGYIRSKAGSGFYVEPINIKPEFRDMFGQNTVQCEQYKPKSYKYDFKTSGVDTDKFPFSAWSKILREILTEKNNELLQNTNPQGLYILREQIARYLYNFRGMTVNPEQIIIGAGSEYLTGMIIQLLGRNKKYGMENPGYNKVYKIFKSNGVKSENICLDKYGVDTNEVIEKSIDVLHITPSHHFPLGIVMPIKRRLELLNWVEKSAERYIIEDDYDSEFRFTGKPIPALQSLDKSDKVLYINTFTKTLAPSMRISYLVLPPKLLKLYREKFMFYSCTVPSFEQYTLCEFMKRGFFDRHINRMRKVYREKRNVLITAIRNSSLASRIEILGENSGLHFLLKVNCGMTEKQLVETAKINDVRVYGLSEFYTDTRPDAIPESTVVVGYASMTNKDMVEGIQILAKSWT